jgi:hypothetical protein
MTETFQKLLDMKYRWPKRGDRIIQKISKQTDVYFPEHPFERSTFIWSGYFRSAKVLIEQCEREEFDRNYLTFPILFCYRHALETALKYLIEEYGAMADVSLPEENSHNLMELWKLHDKLIKNTLGQSLDEEATAAVGRVVQDFHELDSGSFAFRYATNKNGILIQLPSGVVSLATLKDVMEGCENFFDGSDGYYSDMISNLPTGY